MEDLKVDSVDLTIKGVSKYLDEGNSVDSCNEYGVTLLHKAAMVNSFEVVNFLLENGANANLRTFRGRATPLDFARERADANTISLLQKETGTDKNDSNVRRLEEDRKNQDSSLKAR